MNDTPRVPWKPIGDASEIQPGKTILLWPKEGSCPLVAYRGYPDNCRDEESDLFCSAHYCRNWDYYSHWCYVVAPL